MAESDIFAKLSRILETNDFDDGSDVDVDQFLDSGQAGANMQSSPIPPPPARQSNYKELNITQSFLMDRPTPFEIWKQKQKNTGKVKETPKLNPQQWDKLVDKMHQTNRTMQSAMVRDQNQGFALELGGYEFKPRMNKTSSEYAATMKSLRVRMPEMMSDKEKFLATRRKERADEEVAECTFKPELAASMTQRYVKKMGRSAANPEDFFKFRDDKLRRNEMRKQIIAEVEAKELTFQPQLNANSMKLQDKLRATNGIVVDPVTKQTVVKPRKADLEAAERQYPGPALVLDSDHPYRPNTNEYISVAIPGAVSYSVSFSEDTATEPIHDFVKFFKDETHTDFWGCGKYSGGSGGCPGNWPGQGPRPPLTINAPKFVVHFRTNGSVQDWGFKMSVVPILQLGQEGLGALGPGNPEITHRAHQLRSLASDDEPAHERLYKSGVEKKIKAHNDQAEYMQARLNLGLKPWESSRNADPAAQTAWTQAKTHTMKMPNAPIIEEMVVDDGEPIPVSVIEYDDMLAFLWRGLRTCKTATIHEKPIQDDFDFELEEEEEDQRIRTDL